MKRTATAVWNGTIKEGVGHLTTQSNVLNRTRYSFYSRFGDGDGTNPEELMAAAHAGCFAMKLSFDLSVAGFTADLLEVQCIISLEGGAIISSHLILKAKIPELTDEQFREYATGAKVNCPVRKACKLSISLDAILL